MTSPKFAETHNVVAFLEKPVEIDGFAEIIDFLKASSVHYALTIKPIIYTSCIEQIWATTKVQTVNKVRQLQALVDKKRVIITESSIRSDLHLDDAEGTDCLPNATVFENWHVWVFINQQLGDMSHHKKIFVNPFHTKKAFANMKRAGKDFSRRITPLFDTMMVQASKEVGEDLDHPTDSIKHPLLINHLHPLNPSRNKTQVLDLEKAKDAQAKEIAALKKRIQRLERKKMSRPTCLKRLKKFGMSRRVKSSKDQESLVALEDASKQRRSIAEIDADVEMHVDAKVDEEDEQSTKLDD
ncbi:hypothetical protein Tco_1581121, partial [Tanacetum coccineum]